jgi:hypothetical protein
MLLNLTLASAALLGGISTGVLILAVVGIRRGDHGRRLTGRPANGTEAFARWMLTGSRDCKAPADAEENQ